jgi:hypothetical protein
MGARFEEGTTDVAAGGNSRLGREVEARPPPGRRVTTPGRRGAPHPDDLKVTTNGQVDQPTSGKVPNGTVGHSSETTSGTTNGTTNETTIETTNETNIETNQRTTEIESGSIVSAHKFGQSKPVSIGGCNRNYKPLSGPSAPVVLRLHSVCAHTDPDRSQRQPTDAPPQRFSRHAEPSTMLNVLSTFLELYKSYGPVDLTQFFEMFDSATVPAPAARLLRFLSTSDDTAKVLVYVSGTADAPRVGVLHGLFRFLPSMTGQTPWDGQIYALHDDIVDDSRAVTPLSTPGAIFNKATAVHVPTLGTMTAVWAAHNTATPNVSCLDTIAAGDPQTESVTTRYYMGVPNQYVALVMANVSRTPSQFWHEVCEVIIADGVAAECAPLLDWGRVASTYATAGVNTLHGHQPTAVLPDATFRKRLTAKVDKELPVAPATPAPVAA